MRPDDAAHRPLPGTDPLADRRAGWGSLRRGDADVLRGPGPDGGRPPGRRLRRPRGRIVRRPDRLPGVRFTSRVRAWNDPSVVLLHLDPDLGLHVGPRITRRSTRGGS